MEMDDKAAIAIFTRMLQEPSRTDEEREALRHAIGILGWTKLIEGYTENRKKKRDLERQLD